MPFFHKQDFSKLWALKQSFLIYVFAQKSFTLILT